MFYVEKRIDAARFGTRINGVKCDQCGCEYYYQLARVGTGSAIAPYYVGQSAALRSADDQSERDLAVRLTSEAELVPCPKCNWINEELVQGYRQGRYRSVRAWAIGVAAFGTFGSLIAAWFLAIGPAADRPAIPYVLIGGPAIFVLFAAAMILLRICLRSRIRPNRDFPREPQLPLGSPAALVMNANTGELEPARPNRERVDGRRDLHDFQFGRHRLPLICCECLQSVTSTEHAYKLFSGTTVELPVPRCADCARRSKHDAFWIWSIILALAALGDWGLLFLLNIDDVEFWILFVTTILFAIGSVREHQSAQEALGIALHKQNDLDHCVQLVSLSICHRFCLSPFLSVFFVFCSCSRSIRNEV